MLSDIRESLSGAFKGSLVDFVDLESLEDGETLTTNTGGLVSIVRLSGAMGMHSPESLGDLAARLRVVLSPFMDGPGHAVEFYFSQDPAAGSALVAEEVERSGRVAERMGLDIGDILEARRAHLSEIVVEERCLLAIHTASSVLDRETRRRAGEEREARLKGSPRADTGQVPGRILDAVWKRHRGLIDSVVTELSRRKFLVALLSVEDAMREVRAVMRPETSARRDAWRPRLPGWWGGEEAAPYTMMPDRPEEMAGDDVSNVLAPDFAWQLCDEDAVEIDSGVVRIGDVLVAGFDITLFQERVTPFDALVDRISMSAHKFPWRVAFLLEPGGLQAMGLKEQFSRVFSWASAANRRIASAMEGLRAVDGRTDTVVRMRMSFAGWGPVSDIGEFRDTMAGLRSVVQQWGNCHVDGLSGDPLATVMSSVPAVSRRSTAPVVAAPLGAALMVTPISRQASPWSSGAMLFRTGDGKLWPYEPGSSRQIRWNDLYVGQPGSGKSVMLNAVNLALVLARGSAERLPRIGIIDIGTTSSGLIDLIRGALPPNKRHEVLFRRLRNDAAQSVNPLDTQLGMRRPLAAERQFLVNFFSVLLSEQGPDGAVPPGRAMMGLVSAALDAAYRRKSDREVPALYAADVEPGVDRVLAETGFRAGAKATWWEAVDHMMAAGRRWEAGVAQRHAVPVISDMNSATSEEDVEQLYRSAQDPATQQPLIESFHRLLSEAVRDFPVLSRPTRFTLSGASIVSLDLDEVTGQGPAMQRQSSLMYMLARHMLTKDYFVDEAEIAGAVREEVLPAIYEEWHVSRSRSMRAVQKRLCIDEWHRTGAVPGMVAQIVQDMREGRKHNVQVGVASQFLSDFSAEMIGAASSVYVHEAADEGAVEALDAAYALTDVERTIVRDELRGPSAQGAPFLLIAKVREGEVRQKLWLTLGPVEIWALSSTAQDVMLRRMLYERLGPRRARGVLASRFPRGTAVPEIESRKVRVEEAGGRVNRRAEDNIVAELAKELEEMGLRVLELGRAG